MKKKVLPKKLLSFPIWNTYFTWKEQLGLFIFVLLGTAIRGIVAFSTPLWRDEIYIFFTARNNSLWKLVTQQHWDTAHPPLHSILLQFWQMISNDPFMLRLPSVITSFFILYLVPILAVKIYKKNRLFPFMFLFVFVFSNTQISMNMVVRPYPFFILFMIISIILFLDILKSNHIFDLKLIGFVIVNILLVHLDYSVVWLFFTYAIFFVWYLFFKPKKLLIKPIFVALVLSALCSLTIVPLLLKNLSTSLELERFIEPIMINNSGLNQNEPMYILVKRTNKDVFVYGKKFNELSHVKLSNDPFPKENFYVGFNLPPLSALGTNSVRFCLVQQSENIKSLVNSCRFQNTIVPIEKNMTVPFSNKIRNFFLGKTFEIVNLHMNNWELGRYKIGHPINEESDILFELNLNSNYVLNPPGINIYGVFRNSTQQTPWWKNISRFTISPTEGVYRVEYYDGSSAMPIRIFGEKGFFERYSGAILFFSGLPDTFNAYVFLFSATILMIFVQSLHLLFLLRSKNHHFMFMFFLFIIPIFSSLLVSYFYVPLFLARNLHMVNLSFLCGIAILFSTLLSNRSKYLRYVVIAFGLLLSAIYLFLFIIKYPYLYYVDPPYELKKIVKIVDQVSPRKKVLFVLGNNKHYIPLLEFLGLMTNDRREILIIPLPFFEKLKVDAASLSQIKMNNNIYFIQFLESEDGENINTFMNVGKKLDCHTQQIQIPYIYFSQCR